MTMTSLSVSRRIAKAMFGTAALALSLTCADATSPLSEIAVTPCGLGSVTFFAFQPKGGAWTPVVGSAGTFRFQPPDTVGIAFTTELTASSFATFVFYLTKAELASYAAISCATAATDSVSGSVAAVPAGNKARVSVRGASTVVTPTTSTLFTLVHKAGSTGDLLASSDTTIGPALVPEIRATRVIIRRGQSLAAGAPVAPLAFGAGGESQPVSQHSLTVSGVVGNETTLLSQTYMTVGGTGHRLITTSASQINGVRMLLGVSPSQSVDGDFHSINIIATGGPTSPAVVRNMTRNDATAGDRTMALGPVLINPTITALASGQHGRLRVQLQSQAEYGSFMTASFTATPAGLPARRLTMAVSSGYLGGTPSTWTTDTPELSSLSGYPANAGFALPVSAIWQVAAYNGPTSRFFGEPLKAGAVYSYSFRTTANVF